MPTNPDPAPAAVPRLCICGHPRSFHAEGPGLSENIIVGSNCRYCACEAFCAPAAVPPREALDLEPFKKLVADCQRIGVSSGGVPWSKVGDDFAVLITEVERLRAALAGHAVQCPQCQDAALRAVRDAAPLAQNTEILLADYRTLRDNRKTLDPPTTRWERRAKDCLIDWLRRERTPRSPAEQELAEASAVLDELAAPDTTKSLAQRIRDEFADFKMVVDHCSEIYYHVTQGRITKVNTLPSIVKGMGDDLETERINEAIAEAREEWETGRPPVEPEGPVWDSLKAAHEHFANMERETSDTLAQIRKRIGTTIEFSEDARSVAHYERNLLYFSTRAAAIGWAIDKLKAAGRTGPPLDPRILELARHGALALHEAFLDGFSAILPHAGRFDACEHPDCKLARAAVPQGGEK